MFKFGKNKKRDEYEDQYEDYDIEDYEEEIDLLEEELDEKEKEIEKLKKQNSELKGQLKSKPNAAPVVDNQAMKQLEQEKVNLQRNQEQWMNEKQAIIDENKQLKLSKQQLQEQIRLFTDERQRMTQMNNQLSIDLSSKQQEIKRLSKQILSLQGNQTTNETSDKDQELQKENAALTNEIKELQEKLENALIDVRVAEDKLQMQLTNAADTNGHSDEVDRLKTEIDQLNKQIETLSSTTDTTGMVESLQAENKELESVVSNLKAESADLNNQLTQLRSEGSVDTNQLSSFEANNKELKREIDHLIAELKDARENERTVRYENQELQTQIASLREKLDTLGNAASQVTNTAAASNDDEILRLEGRNSALQRELRQTEESYSRLEAKYKALQSQQDPESSKAVIADVLLQAQKKAKEITDRANQEVKEAKKLLSRVEYELELVTRDARNYYRQTEEAKAKADQLFQDMLKQVDGVRNIK